MHRICTLFCLAALACITFQQCRPAPVKQVAEKKDPVKGLIFLTFVMKNDSVSGKEIGLVSQTVVYQKLKSGPPDSTSPNRLMISQLNGDGKKLSSVAIEHPLLRRVEYPNDEGRFQSKEIRLKDAQFFVRVTLLTDTEYILVEEELSGTVTYSAKFKLEN